MTILRSVLFSVLFSLVSFVMPPAAQAAAPPNDAFSAAQDLGGASTASVPGRNDGASAEPGEPSHEAFQPPADSVWYSWTAPARGSLTIDAEAAQPTVLAAYTGDAVWNLTRVPNQAQDWRDGPHRIRIRVEAGTTYRLAVAAPAAGAGGDFALTLSRIDSPANDDFADAALLAGPSADVAGTNVGATQEPGEPIHEDNYRDPSVWYSWTAPATAGVTLDTAGSTFHTVIAVYTGNSVGSLTRVPSTLALGTTQAKRHFRAVAGVTYRIAIDGASARQGTFTLTLRTRPVPPNDHFADAQVLTGTTLETEIAGDTVAATGEHREPNAGGTAGATVWYSWTAPADGPARIAVLTRDFEGSGTVYTGSAIGSLSRIAWFSLGSTLSFNAVRGTTYRVSIDGGEVPSRGTFSLRLGLVTHDPSGPPVNDAFAAPAVLEGASSITRGTTVNATREPGEPLHHGGFGGSSVWYAWTAPLTGNATVAIANAVAPSTLGVYAGDTVAGLTRVTASDGTATTFRVVAGTTYRIAADIYHDWRGAFDLVLRAHLAPANDDFDDAAVLDGPAADVTGTTTGASREPFEPHHGERWGNGSIWYRWQAPASGPVSVDTSDSTIDTLLGVYTGSNVDSSFLHTVASNDDHAGARQSRVTFRAEAGTVYRIAVAAKGDQGPVALRLRQGIPPVGDVPVAAPDAERPAAEVDVEQLPTTARTADLVVEPAPSAAAAPPAPPLTVSASLRRQRLTTALRRGLVGTARCSRACRLDITVLAGATAGRARASARASVRAVEAGAGGTRFTLRLSRSARRALADLKQARMTLRVVATSGGARAAVTSRATLTQ